MRRWLLFVLAVVLCVIALNKRTTVEFTQPVLPLDVVSSEVSNELSETTIQNGEGVVQAIERAENASIANFKDIGVLISRDGNQLAHIDGLRALSYFDLAGLVLQPGDIVRWGKVADVQSQVLSGVPVAHGWLDVTTSSIIFFSWGIPGDDSLWRIEPGESSWTQLK